MTNNIPSVMPTISLIDEIPYQADEKVRIVLVVQAAAVWTSLRSFAFACQQHELVDLHIVVLPFFHSYMPDDTCIDMHNCLKKDGLTFFDGKTYDVEAFKPHVVMLPNPYESTRPSRFHTHFLISCGYRVAYIPYGLEMGGGAENDIMQFNLGCQNNAWRIFARSNRHKKMFDKHCDAGSDHVVVTGHPKLDAQFEIPLHSLSMNEVINGRKVILWTPHFAVGLPATWSSYRLYGEFIVEQTERFPELFFIIRPHPLFFGAMKEHLVWDEQGEADFRALCQHQDNIFLDEDANYLTSFFLANGLMADVGSFLLEFLPTKKPILYLHHPDGYGMNDDRDLVDFLYIAQSENDITAFLNQILNGDDPKEQERLAIIPEFLFKVDGQAGKRICDYIVNELICESHLNLNAVDEEFQKKSNSYWASSTTTFLAPPKYYVAKEHVLTSIVTSLPQSATAIDIGCGDGHFTRLIAKNVDRVEAYDLSQLLINKAKENAIKHSASNIDFITCDVSEIPTNNSFGLIFCMDFISCMLDDIKYGALLDKIKSLAAKDGYLILTDTLSLRETKVLNGNNGYVAKYRFIKSYLSEITQRGFEFIETREILNVPSNDIVNKFFIFKYVS
jgi:2-polyprenyl-3-methyl-5-hydroxy-6-metoxy-1,4-benzoquinol methylase